jgi:hypothetical protein
MKKAYPNEFWILTIYPGLRFMATAERRERPGVRPEYRQYNSREALDRDFPGAKFVEAP